MAIPRLGGEASKGIQFVPWCAEEDQKESLRTLSPENTKRKRCSSLFSRCREQLSCSVSPREVLQTSQGTHLPGMAGVGADHVLGRTKTGRARDIPSSCQEDGSHQEGAATGLCTEHLTKFLNCPFLPKQDQKKKGLPHHLSQEP